MSNPPVGFWKVWFFLRNNVDVPLSVLKCSVAALSLNPNGGTVWPRRTSVGYNPCVMLSSGYGVEGSRAWTSCGPLLATTFNHSISEE
jgi:hypothetical protein